MLVNVLQERLSGAFYVGFQELAGGIDLPLDAQTEQFVVFGLGPRTAIGQCELEASVPITFLQEVRHYGE
jgi:hypothetical protein